MKQRKWLVALVLLAMVTACADQPFYDVYKPIINKSWHHHEKLSFPVHIPDNTIPYDVSIFIRHTGEYDFSTFFFVIRETDPKAISDTSMYKLNLATADGRWIGKSAGNLYERKMLLKEGYTFPDTGMYMFEMEQNMQDNPIHHITDVGLKLERK